MTFEPYFQQVQTLITRKIDLPFDVPFGVWWTDKYKEQFRWDYLHGLTPIESVRCHFFDIDYKAEQLKKKRKRQRTNDKATNFKQVKTLQARKRNERKNKINYPNPLHSANI